MKVIDEKGKFLGTINIIDLAIIVIIIAAAVFLYLNINYGSDDGIVSDEEYSTEEITVMYLIQDVREATVNAFRVGDPLSVVDEDSALKEAGEISNIVVSNHQVSDVVDGEVLYIDVPEKYDIKLYTTVSADIYEDEIKIGSYVPRVGKSVSIWTQLVATSGVVYYISQG